jgi:transcription termination/antitermination protein NusA
LTRTGAAGSKTKDPNQINGELLVQAIRQASREKDIDPEKMFRALEDAIATAVRRQDHTKEPVAAEINRENGSITVFTPKAVVETVEDPLLQVTPDEAQPWKKGAVIGDEIRIPRKSSDLGRIAAQSAKQVLIQKVREAERDNVHAEYADKVGQLLNGTVKRFERGDMIVDLGRTEAIVPRDHQSRAERYVPGERVRAVVVDVHKNPKGPQIVLSRTDPTLLIRLFEMEVPEIYDGTVLIKGAVREPGERAKIAVASRERDVDPVGACVGMKGSRVQAIIRELRGERIDIIPWSDDIVTYAQNALAPAKITRVSVGAHDGRTSLDCIVEDEQLSLAIGRKGQNVRLASALIGSRIEIKSEQEVKGEVANALSRMLQVSMRRGRTLAEVPGITDVAAELLAENGYDTVGSIEGKEPSDIAEIGSMGEEAASGILDSVKAFLDAPLPSPSEDEEEEEDVEYEDEDEDEVAEDEGEDAAESEDETEETTAETEGEPKPTA